MSSKVNQKDDIPQNNSTSCKPDSDHGMSISSRKYSKRNNNAVKEQTDHYKQSRVQKRRQRSISADKHCKDIDNYNKKSRNYEDHEGEPCGSKNENFEMNDSPKRRTNSSRHQHKSKYSSYNKRYDKNNRIDHAKDQDKHKDWHQSRNKEKGNGFRYKSRHQSPSVDDKNVLWGKEDGNIETKYENGTKQKPNFSLSGKLTEERNTYRGVVIKYSEPSEARKPKRRWRLYPFKGEKAMQTLYIHRESAYLIGRDRKIVDLPVDHPSCSKQHAAIQYRLVPFTKEDGSVGKRVRPYLIDLDSANGTYINNKKIDPRKYVELLEKDVIKFGYSSREYVLLHENSKDETQDDDVKQEQEEMFIKNEMDAC